MLISLDSNKPLARLREDLQRACAERGFGVLGVIDLKSKLREKGIEHARECMVFEVCSPPQAKRVLDASPDMASMLPCRIAVVEVEPGKMRLSTVRPTRLVELLAPGELGGVAREVEEALAAIIEQAGS